MFGKHKHRWEVARTIWPYPDGYGVWCPRCKTVVDTGLPKEQAEEIVKGMKADASAKR